MPNRKSYQIYKKMIYNKSSVQCMNYRTHRIVCYNYICVGSSKLRQFHQMQIAGSCYPSELDSSYFVLYIENTKHYKLNLSFILSVG